MLFTFPSRYWSTIGLKGVFSLTGWSRLIHAEFLVLRATQDTTTKSILTCTGLSPPTDCLSRQVPVRIFLRYRGPITPDTALTVRVWANPRSLATTCGITCCFLFLQVLRCFSSLRLLLIIGDVSSTHRVTPFGYLRIKGRLHLPEAFRSLPRPS